MKVTVAAHLPTKVMVRLITAAHECDVPVARHAGLAVTAAAQLYLVDEHTTAMPRGPVRQACPETLAFSITGDTMQIVSEAATAHCLTIEQQLVAILTASVRRYATPEPAAPERPPPPAIARRRPFDPKYYAEKGVAFR